MPSRRSPSNDESGLVYSTDAGRMCPACRQPLAACRCAADDAARQAAQNRSGDGVARVTCETQGRGGKAVTVVRGLQLPDEQLLALGKQLRTACGAGGTVKGGVIEVQGDHAERAVQWLLQKGLKAKRAGG